MAILHPVEIEELPYQQEDSKLDEETEGKIQAAIDQVRLKEGLHVTT